MFILAIALLVSTKSAKPDPDQPCRVPPAVIRAHRNELTGDPWWVVRHGKFYWYNTGHCDLDGHYDRRVTYYDTNWKHSSDVPDKTTHSDKSDEGDWRIR